VHTIDLVVIMMADAALGQDDSATDGEQVGAHRRGVQQSQGEASGPCCYLKSGSSFSQSISKLKERKGYEDRNK